MAFSKALITGANILSSLALRTGEAIAQSDERVTVRVDGRALFRLCPDGEISAADRAARTDGRTRTLLEDLRAIVRPRIETPAGSPGPRIFRWVAWPFSHGAA